MAKVATPLSINAQLLQQLSTGCVSDADLEHHARKIETLPEGKAWLELTRDLEAKYTRNTVIEGDGLSIPGDSSASASFWSALARTGLEIEAGIGSRIKYDIAGWQFLPAIAGFELGTLYYNDSSDLQLARHCLVVAYAAGYNLIFGRDASDPLMSALAIFRASNVFIPDSPLPFWLADGHWSNW